MAVGNSAVLVVGFVIAGVMGYRGVEGVASLGNAHVRAVMPGSARSMRLRSQLCVTPSVVG